MAVIAATPGTAAAAAAATPVTPAAAIRGRAHLASTVLACSRCVGSTAVPVCSAAATAVSAAASAAYAAYAYVVCRVEQPVCVRNGRRRGRRAAPLSTPTRVQPPGHAAARTLAALRTAAACRPPRPPRHCCRRCRPTRRGQPDPAATAPAPAPALALAPALAPASRAAAAAAARCRRFGGRADPWAGAVGPRRERRRVADC